MKWYLAKLVYRIVCGTGKHTAQFDEQLRVIFAHSQEEALEKATRIGEEEAEDFYNHKQQLVSWRFINVSELYPLHALIDGAELYSSIREVEDADSYTSFVHHKAAVLTEKQEAPFFNLI